MAAGVQGLTSAMSCDPRQSGQTGLCPGQCHDMFMPDFHGVIPLSSYAILLDSDVIPSVLKQFSSVLTPFSSIPTSLSLGDEVILLGSDVIPLDSTNL